MKELLVLMLSIFVFYGCKTEKSGTYSLVEKAGKVYYLFGASVGDNGTPIVCRYSCSAEPRQVTKRSLCSDPIYIKKEVLKSSNLSIFLKYIEDDSKVFIRKKIDQPTENRLASLFYKAEEEKEVYDNSIGDPDKVCDVVLESETGSVMIESSSSDESPSSPKGEIVEIESIDEVSPGYPALVIYSNINTCPPCRAEHSWIEQNQGKFEGKMHIYHVALQNNNFSGNTNPCGRGIPQNQIFDKDAKQVSCYVGFNKQAIISRIEELSGVFLQ